MKKTYNKPTVTMIQVDEKDIIATSGLGFDKPDQPSEARQRNPIWDDYE